MGGNIFENTQPINKEDIEPTINQFKTKLNEVFPKIDFDFKLLGSTGRKSVSNDIDLALSEDIIFDKKRKVKYDVWEIDYKQYAIIYKKIRKRVRTATIKQSKIKALVEMISSKINNSNSGIITDPINSGSGSLFCCFPQYSNNEELNKIVQIDINIGNLDWLLFSYYSEIYEDNIKGLHRTQLLVALFANKNRIFRHGSGIFNSETRKYEAKTPEEAIKLLNKLYINNVDRFNRTIVNNFFYLTSCIKFHFLNEECKIYDIYLKILDSTKTDIPIMLQDYWIQNQERLNLRGKFLPKESKLYEWINRRE
jgi:hypothetical protein